MTTSRSCVPRVEKNRRNMYKSKLILGAKRRRKSNVTCTYEYKRYIYFGMKHERLTGTKTKYM